MSKYLKYSLLASALFMMSVVHAEGSAPVYDADNYPPQFDGQSDAQAQPQQAQPQSEAQAETQPMPQERAESAPDMSSSQRIARLEQRINNLQNSDTNVRVSSLQTEVQTLRGQVEEMTHKLEQLQSQQQERQQSGKMSSSSQAQMEEINRQLQQVQIQQRDLTMRLNKRLNHGASANDTIVKSIEPHSEVADKEQEVKPQKVADKPEIQPNAEEEQQVYQNAYNYIKDKKYNEAIAAFQSMLHKYPSGQFAANAHYWLGELYGLQNNNAQSANEFGIVVKNYADSSKVSDAQLKLGMIHASQLKWKEARAAFKKVINKYPGTTSAKVAADQLKQMKLAGH